MNINVSEQWLEVLDEGEEKKNLAFTIVIVVGLIASAIALVFLIEWEYTLVDSTGIDPADFTLDIVWIVLIAIGTVIGCVLIVWYIFQDCHNATSMVSYGFIVGGAALIVIHFLGHGIYFATMISGTTGDESLILCIRVATHFLFVSYAVFLIVGVVWGLYHGKKECDIVGKGTLLPTTYASGAGMSVKVQCKELDGKKMCRVPIITSIE